jgi:phage terminase small subunit
MNKLTPKQEMFCKEYLIDLNATQAAIRAGYSPKTAKETGYENLTKPHIAEYINDMKSKREEKVEITAEGVLRDLQLARDITLGLKPHHIVSTVEGIPMSSELHKTDMTNFVKINEIYMKHLGMFTEKLEVKGEVKVETGMAALYKKTN